MSRPDRHTQPPENEVELRWNAAASTVAEETRGLSPTGTLPDDMAFESLSTSQKRTAATLLAFSRAGLHRDPPGTFYDGSGRKGRTYLAPTTGLSFAPAEESHADSLQASHEVPYIDTEHLIAGNARLSPEETWDTLGLHISGSVPRYADLGENTQAAIDELVSQWIHGAQNSLALLTETVTALRRDNDRLRALAENRDLLASRLNDTIRTTRQTSSQERESNRLAKEDLQRRLDEATDALQTARAAATLSIQLKGEIELARSRTGALMWVIENMGLEPATLDDPARLGAEFRAARERIVSRAAADAIREYTREHANTTDKFLDTQPATEHVEDLLVQIRADASPPKVHVRDDGTVFTTTITEPSPNLRP
jgi:hypothetical protein